MTERKGSFMIVGAALLWGVSATAAKLLLTRDVPSVLIVQVRVTVSFLLLLAYLAATRRALLRIAPRDLWKFAVIGVGGVAGSNFLYYFAIKETTVATAILLQYTAPLLIMAYAALTGEERLSSVKMTASLVALAGCSLAVGAFESAGVGGTPLGVLSGSAAAFSFAFLGIGTRRMLRRYSFWTVLLYSLGAASAFWLVINPSGGLTNPGMTGGLWLALIALAVGSVLIPHGLFFAGLRSVVPSRAIIISMVEPVVAIASAALVVGERLTPIQSLGAVFVLGAIAWLELRKED
jgi:drug/metabolite transporter (DMT)-like permease